MNKATFEQAFDTSFSLYKKNESTFSQEELTLARATLSYLAILVDRFETVSLSFLLNTLESAKNSGITFHQEIIKLFVQELLIQQDTVLFTATSEVEVTFEGKEIVFTPIDGLLLLIFLDQEKKGTIELHDSVRRFKPDNSPWIDISKILTEFQEKVKVFGFELKWEFDSEKFKEQRWLEPLDITEETKRPEFLLDYQEKEGSNTPDSLLLMGKEIVLNAKFQKIAITALLKDGEYTFTQYKEDYYQGRPENAQAAFKRSITVLKRCFNNFPHPIFEYDEQQEKIVLLPWFTNQLQN